MIAAGIAFALLSALALAGLAANRVPWQAKLVVIALVPAYGFLLWHGIYSQAGWPVAKNLPKRALLVSYVVDEPDSIYVWMIPEPESRLPFDYKPSDGEPRAYRLPYSRTEHGELEEAGKAQAQGQQVALELVGDGAGNPSRGTRIPKRYYRVYPFPTPLPPKEAP